MKHWLYFGWMLVLAASCTTGGETNQKPVVSVTILPQQFFVEKIAGTSVEVNVMVPPGASPATYEPTVQQLKNLDRSPLYLKIGYVEFELGWMGKIADSNPSMKIVDLSEGIALLSGDLPERAFDPSPAESHSATEHVAVEHASEGHAAAEHKDHVHTGADPHIWMSARNARLIARSTCKALVSQFPEQEEIFNHHLEKFLEEIDTLDQSLSDMLHPYSGRAFMIYHPALTYFARDYHLEQYPLEMGGKTPSPRHMQRMVDLGRDQNISAIFVQQQFDQRNATVLANEIGARVIRIDPLSPDWSSELAQIAEQLKASFE